MGTIVNSLSPSTSVTTEGGPVSASGSVESSVTLKLSGPSVTLSLMGMMLPHLLVSPGLNVKFIINLSKSMPSTMSD